ncbi:MAG: site-specific integrase [Bacteroidota bacterium]
MSEEKKLFFVNGVEVRLHAPLDLSKDWFFEWRENGKRKRRYSPINRESTRKARQAVADHVLQNLEQYILPCKNVDQSRVEVYVESMHGQWRHSTLVNVRSIIKILFEWLDGKELNRKNLEEFFNHLSKQRHSTTYNHYRMWLSRIFAAIDRPGLLVNIPMLKTKKTPARYFQPHQIEKLRNVIQEEDPQLWLYVQFVFYCFIRPSRELPHIKASNIMLEEQKILVWAERSKNKKTQYVTIPNVFMSCLEFVYDMAPNDYIFPGLYDKSKPIGRNTMSARHRRILKRLNFGRGYCLYSWKHTGAIQAVKNGIDVVQLMIQLRHHSLQETHKYLRQMGVQDATTFRSQMPDLNVISR